MDRQADVDEGDLIRDYLKGDPAATQLVDEWINVVLRQDFRSLQEDWEDLRQETRIRLFRNLSRGRFGGRSALRTYVHRIAKNVAIDASRLAYRRRESGVDLRNFANTEPDKEVGDTDLAARDLFVKVLEQLPEGDRLLLSLVLGEHLSYVEVARRLGITEGAVKTRMFRCKERVVRFGREFLR